MFKHFLVAVAALVAFAAPALAQRDEIIVAGGCFWCVESDFEGVKGVQAAISGYTGGTVPDPSYKQVSSGKTGHFEAVRIIFDPTVIPLDRLLDLFFRSIDPTDPGGQFCDRGPTYRTAIFARPDQMAAARAARARAEAALGRKIVTEIRPAGPFYPAEDYHQDFYKSSDRILTRFGVRRKSDAYRRYRKACGRDSRLREVWGEATPFAHDD